MSGAHAPGAGAGSPGAGDQDPGNQGQGVAGGGRGSGLENLDEKAISQEIEQFNREKDKIRGVLESIGMTKGASMNRLVDAAFIAALVLLLMARFAFGWVDNILSLELGLILISVKILWLIKVQSNYNHFIFMIMHTIESHQTYMIEKLDGVEGALRRIEGGRKNGS